MSATSLTDTVDWRAFCSEAAGDLSLVTGDDPRMVAALGATYEQSMRRYELIADQLAGLYVSGLHGRHVLEVGGGFGGMAQVCQRRWSCRWSIVDLPEASRLQRAFLGRPPQNMRGADFGYSAYALSELNAEPQRLLAESLAGCEHGYIVWNGWLNPDGLEADELAAYLPAGNWLPEDPPSHPDNRVYLW